MGPNKRSARTWLLLALPALVVCCVITGVLFGMAAALGLWAYIALGALGGYFFSWRLTMEQRDCIAIGACGGTSGAVAWWVSASIGGIGGAIIAMFIGALVSAALITIAFLALHYRELW